MLFVGRLIRLKGIDKLIRAMPAVARHHPDIRLTVIGKGSPRFTALLKALARHHGVQRRIQWRGFIPHRAMLSEYQRHGAVVIPSEQESFGLVALEAMARGVPVVATRAGGLSEFVSHRNAQVIRAVTSSAVAQAIRDMLRNPARTRLRARRAKQTASRYEWHRIAGRYKNIIAGMRGSIGRRDRQ